jgi:hypothetical protein
MITEGSSPSTDVSYAHTLESRNGLYMQQRSEWLVVCCPQAMLDVHPAGVSVSPTGSSDQAELQLQSYLSAYSKLRHCPPSTPLPPLVRITGPPKWHKQIF